MITSLESDIKSIYASNTLGKEIGLSTASAKIPFRSQNGKYV